MKWVKDFETIYAFQISDGINMRQVRDLYETESEKRFYLVDGQDRPFMEKKIREIGKEFPDVIESITFISLKDIRTTLESSLAKEVIGTTVYNSIPDPNVKFSGSMADVDIKAGLFLSKLGKDLGYIVRNPEVSRYVWYEQDKRTKVLEAIIGNGFSFRNVRSLSSSSAKKKMYLATRLYGDIYHEAVDRIVGLFPDAMIEFMSIAEVGTTKELKALIGKRIITDLKIEEQVEAAKKRGGAFEDW